MSASGACSVDGEWGLESLGPAFPSVDVSEFSRVITCEMGKIRDKCCSVEAFLQMRLQDPEAARGFVKFLLSCWPLPGAVDFCTESVFPTSREAEGRLAFDPPSRRLPFLASGCIREMAHGVGDGHEICRRKSCCMDLLPPGSRCV